MVRADKLEPPYRPSGGVVEVDMLPFGTL
jgi:hypothetical protein